MRAIVVGAGLGGLCAANGLARAGVEVTVLEARPDLGDREHGYRININAAGEAALRACLDPEHFAAYRRSRHRQDDAAVYLFTPELRLLSRSELPPVPGAVDRGMLRRVLADGVPGRIDFGRRITTLADVGDSDLVVAADGAGSALRRELLPGTGPEPLGWTAIFGRTPLTAQNRPWTAPVIRHSRFCGLADPRTVLALCAFDPEEPVGTAPYVMWVLMGPDDDLPGRGTTPAELVRFARDRVSGWDPRATALLAESVPADTFRTPLRAMPEIPDIPTTTGVPVAFLGDAIHAMSPAGGEGANTALTDAALLVSEVERAADPAAAVAAYHRGMRVGAGAALRRSAAFAGHANRCVQEASRA